MTHSLTRFAFVFGFSTSLVLLDVSGAKAFSAGDYAWVDLGTAQLSPFGPYEVYYDSSSIPTSQDTHTVFDLKGNVPSQDFYLHFAGPHDIQQDVPDSEGGPIAAYFTIGIDVDCQMRAVHGHHMIFHNASNWRIADHDFKGAELPSSSETLGALVLQNVCGS